MLVVEDSITVRKRLCEVLSASLEIAVVGEAEDGKKAIELCLENRASEGWQLPAEYEVVRLAVDG